MTKDRAEELLNLESNGIIPFNNKMPIHPRGMTGVEEANLKKITKFKNPAMIDVFTVHDILVMFALGRKVI